MKRSRPDNRVLLEENEYGGPLGATHRPAEWLRCRFGIKWYKYKLSDSTGVQEHASRHSFLNTQNRWIYSADDT